MLAHRPPGRPGPRECLGDRILGRLAVPGAGDYRPQAVVLGCLVELCETISVWAHDIPTPQPADPSGLYHFRTETGMAGKWALTLGAKVQGETDTVRGTVIYDSK